MLKIIRDTREQAGYTFSDFPDVQATTETLVTGDYSLHGFTDRIAIERKALNDLLGCLTANRDRFFRELERLRAYDAAALVVEATYKDIALGRYRSRIPAETVIQSLVSIQANFRLPVVFSGSAQAGEKFVHDFFRHYQRHEVERYKAIAADLNAEG